jgi:hypothetical protein
VVVPPEVNSQYKYMGIPFLSNISLINRIVSHSQKICKKAAQEIITKNI